MQGVEHAPATPRGLGRDAGYPAVVCLADRASVKVRQEISTAGIVDLPEFIDIAGPAQDLRGLEGEPVGIDRPDVAGEENAIKVAVIHQAAVTHAARHQAVGQRPFAGPDHAGPRPFAFLPPGTGGQARIDPGQEFPVTGQAVMLHGGPCLEAGAPPYEMPPPLGVGPVTVRFLHLQADPVAFLGVPLQHPSVKGILALAVAGVGLSLAPESRASPPATSTCERGNPAGARQRGHDRDCKTTPGTQTFLSTSKVTDGRLFIGNDLGGARVVSEGGGMLFPESENRLPRGR